MQVKIIEPIREYSKVFNTPDEFNIWYSKNKDDIDALTTHKLNKMYKIEGYRITKIKNVLMLKKDCNNVDNQQSCLELAHKDKDLREDLQSKTLSLESEVAKIRDTINQIITYLNLSKQ